jgi:hypothetical protein
MIRLREVKESGEVGAIVYSKRCLFTSFLCVFHSNGAIIIVLFFWSNCFYLNLFILA